MKTSLCPDCIHDQSGAWHPYELTKEVVRKNKLGNILYFVFDALNFGAGLLRLIPKTFYLNSHNPSSSAVGKQLNQVVIIGAYGGEHVGDAAILGGVILRLHKEYEIKKAIVLSIRVERTKRWLRCLDLPIEIQVLEYSPANIYNSIEKTGALVYGGGPIMDLPKSLLSHLDAVITAKQFKVPFILEGIGIGPFRNFVSKTLGRLIINQADKITIRTKDATDWFSRQEKNIFIKKDPAFDYLESRCELSLITERESNSLNKLLSNAKNEIIGINLRPLWKKYSKNLTSDEIGHTEDVFIKKFSQALISLHQKENATFVFFPMNPDQYGFSDLSIAYKLENNLNDLSQTIDYRIWEFEPGIDALLFLIRKFKYAITMRFHASIFCVSQNIPTLGLDYMLQGKGKVYNLFNDLAMQNNVINIQDFNIHSLDKIYDIKKDQT